MGISITKDTKNDEGGGKRRLTITLSTSAFIGVITVALLGFVWVFIFGLMIGRGYQPEESVPKLKQMMPAQSTNNASPEKTQQSKSSPEKERVLQAEELNFFEQLKKKPAPVQKAKRPPKKNGHSLPQDASTVEKGPKTDGAVYDYTYQVAAFRDMPSAEILHDKIRQKGYRASIASGTANGATWYRILVQFRGTAPAAVSLKEALRNLGIQKPFRKSKILVHQ